MELATECIEIEAEERAEANLLGALSNDAQEAANTVQSVKDPKI